jgi:hypothetical protein
LPKFVVIINTNSTLKDIMKKILMLATVYFSAYMAQSQVVVKCATDEMFMESLKQFPDVQLEEQKANLIAAQTPAQQKKATVKYIPVVFHVIHKFGLENISQTQLNDAIRVLNEDFRKMSGTNGGSSTDPLTADIEIEFRLAQYTPNGIPTNGVNRIYNLGTDNARDPQKSISYWDARKYFNVWVVNTINNSSGTPGSIVLGYAQFPFQINSQTATDGIMMRADQMGVIENVDVSQLGRTLTHEAGHWVGLYHPFQGGCVGGTSSNCLSQGDQVCDTPPVSTATTGCPTSRNSCTNDVPNLPDLVKNYMDYADGNCMNMFTQGQKTRINQIMPQYRSNIYSTANLLAAGINADGTYQALPASATKAPYYFGFNTNSLAGTGWNLENYMCPGDSGWQINNTIGLVSSGSMAAMNLKTWRTNVRNAFTSPNIDITRLSSPTLSFYAAYARRSTASGDRIRVFISDNFGRTEVLARTILSTELSSGPVSADPFTPGTDQWKKYTIDLTPYKNYTNLRVRFELQSLRGNNVYIDDFRIDELTSIGEQLKRALSFELFPNPSKGSSTISLVNTQNQRFDIELIDIQGKKIQEIFSGEMQAGNNRLEMDVRGLQSGMYLVQVKSENGMFVHKMWVE